MVAGQVAVVVPHTHWDREWYAPFETMRFHLIRFLDELIETMENDPDLPVFLLDGQSVIIEDYLEIRRSQRDRVMALVAQGRLRLGPFYVQPDEFHVSGEAIVRNLLVGCEVAESFGRVMREGYLPDTFGHVHQLPQILRGFDIVTFYAMRGFGLDIEEAGSEFFWQAPDGSRVFTTWLSESYSNAAVLSPDAKTMSLHHGTLVRYDSLTELLDRLAQHSRTGVLLLLNGGDHLRVQADAPTAVAALNAESDIKLQLGGLEEYHELTLARPPQIMVEGELRSGRRHDVFDGIGSTRTPLKGVNEQIESLLCGVAERLDALAMGVDGRTSHDSLRFAWGELLKNHAHDSICGCSVDEVHRDMIYRYQNVERIAEAVTRDALERIGYAVTPPLDPEQVAIIVVNPSAHARTDVVAVDVVPDLNTPLGERRFGWTQGAGVDWSAYTLLDANERSVPFRVSPAEQIVVADTLNRRKEVHQHHITFVATDVPPLTSATYRLVPTRDTSHDSAARHEPRVERTDTGLRNSHLDVSVDAAGTVSITHRDTGRTFTGLLELVDNGDAGDEYGFGPLPDDELISSTTGTWNVIASDSHDTLIASGTMDLPIRLLPDRRTRSAETVQISIIMKLRLNAHSDRLDVAVLVDNAAEDHRLRMRFPTGTGNAQSCAESAFGVMHRDGSLTEARQGWRDAPTGVSALRRFVTTHDGTAGIQVLTEGLHEYSCTEDGALHVTLLRSVGWLARLDHPLRQHKIGPALPTPEAQCLGWQTFRLGVRPYLSGEPLGRLYQAAEEFSVPLVGCAIQGARHTEGGTTIGPAGLLGLSVSPADVVLSAVKVAEDGNGIIVRVFNSSSDNVIAQLQFGIDLKDVTVCNLEERARQTPTPIQGRALAVDLRGGEIYTLRLRRPDTSPLYP
ncbi:alpha-mannosidase [Nocardia gipuzkoensis]|uniref:alpha-mannosidase n=1 Tax=Nocardia gipuzkoensis TaxID=2749991 RepID=UPI00237DD0C8|nr:glycoside hydrolase family 38 C-terminal domain-containing protein [Nocardia gipuzkoensis]MDE1675318.1 glycoside hydrolase family 38 C-terminal domain-containing protein [Nocardia gipuzkoensis]